MTQPVNLAAQHAQEAAEGLAQWQALDEREGRVPHALATAVPLLVDLAQQCAQRRVTVPLWTRPALRLTINAARRALDAIEDWLLLGYERDRQEAAEQDAKWPRKG